MKISNTTFIITGASSGIGEALSKKLAASGANVVLAARNKSKLNQVHDKIQSSGGSSLVIPTDITDYNACKHLVKETILKFNQIDSLILNAGVSMWAFFDKIEDPIFFKNLMEINYTGAVNCVHTALPHLKRVRGSIVSITTAQAIMGFPAHSGYAASKHALHGFLETLELEGQGSVHFSNIYLGWIKGTSLRQNAFGADGEKIGESSHNHDGKAIDLDTCIKKIIQSIRKDKRQSFIPAKLKFIPFFNLFARGWLHRKALKAVKDYEK